MAAQTPTEVIQEGTLKGVQLWAQRPSVFLAYGNSPLGYATDVGSGFVLRTPRGLPVVITAKHVLEEGATTTRAGWLDFYRGRDLIERYEAHPTVDVGLVVPKRELRDELLKLAVRMDNIDPAYTVGPRDAFAIAGYPASYVATQGDAQRFVALVYGCIPEPDLDEQGRLRFEWMGEALPAVPLFDRGDTARDGPKEPVGMSGGACWAFPPINAGDPWFPDSAARLAGLQVSWHEGERVLYVEPIAKWYEWLVAAVASVDEAS